MIRSFALFGFFGLVALTTCSAGAQTTLHFREGERVDPQEVMRILATAPTAGTTRSIRLLEEAQPEKNSNASASPEASAASSTPAASTPTALSLPIQFAFDSTTILPTAYKQLEALAEGIKMLPADQKVVIEGHTDAAGSDAYNQSLSLRRAAAVKAYLVETYSIAPQRLMDAGYGKRQPIAGTDPYAAENRRVQFHGA